MFFLTNPIEITAYTSFLLVWAVNLFRVCQPNALNKKLKGKENRRDTESTRQTEMPGISVIILTENQEQKLTPLLENVLEQAYDSFEVVVVDKNSTDNTRLLLENMEKRYENLQHTFIPKDTRQVSIHTLALILGAKAARYPWVVLLTPDFQPASGQWLHHLAAQMTADRDFVLGARSVNTGSSSLRAFHCLLEQNRFLSWAIGHQAFRCNEVNLAFRKEKLLSCKNFGEYGILLSGVESVFVNRFSQKERTGVCIEPEALLLETETADSKNWKHEMLCQKEAARFYTHSTLFRLCGGLRMTMIWLLFLLSITALGISILTQRWEITAAIVILLGLWTGLRIREMKTAAQLFRIKTAGIYLPFYDLRLSCVYLANRIRYAFQDRKVFYRNMFH